MMLVAGYPLESAVEYAEGSDCITTHPQGGAGGRETCRDTIDPDWNKAKARAAHFAVPSVYTGITPERRRAMQVVVIKAQRLVQAVPGAQAGLASKGEK